MNTIDIVLLALGVILMLVGFLGIYAVMRRKRDLFVAGIPTFLFLVGMTLIAAGLLP